MRLRFVPCILFLLPLLTPGTSAQSITLLEAHRAVSASAFGYDYDYDDGLLFTDETDATDGEWNPTVDADLIDWWQVPVAHGVAHQKSRLDDHVLAFGLTADASTAGLHFREDANGTGDGSVHFVVPQRMRFSFAGRVEVTTGYNTASVTLRDTTSTIFSLLARYGGEESTETSGWIDAGTYRLEAHLEVFAFGTHGTSEAHSGRADVDLRLGHVADFDVDGDVDVIDVVTFRLAHLTGDPAADFDGDGDVERSDWREFLAAWREGSGDPPFPRPRR